MMSSSSSRLGCSLGLSVVMSIAASHYFMSPLSFSSSSSSSPSPLVSSVLPYLSLLKLSHFLTIGLIIWALRFYYCCFWRPFSYVQSLSHADRSIALTRSYADLPPAYPNAWFKLCDSFEVKVGESKIIELFGQLFTVTRMRMSSEIGTVAEVVGDSNHDETVIQCVDGKGKVWTVAEKNQHVFVWHDDSDSPPTWEIPTAAAGISSWRFHGKATHDIVCHIGEIAENGADTAHLNFVHGNFITNELLGGIVTFLLARVRHTWEATWVAQPAPSGHLAKMNLHTGISVLDAMIPMVGVETNILQIGPGYVQLLFPTPFGSILVQECICPISANLQRADNVVWAEPTVPRFIAKFILKSLVVQFERDFPIWNSKRWLRAPMAVKEDGPILKYRRWTKQFYSNEGGKCIRDADGNQRYEKRSNKHATTGANGFGSNSAFDTAEEILAN